MLRTVKTKLGTVEGIPAADPRITAFKAVPFAKPPVGDLRFAPPQPAEPWEGVRECFKHRIGGILFPSLSRGPINLLRRTN